MKISRLILPSVLFAIVGCGSNLTTPNEANSGTPTNQSMVDLGNGTILLDGDMIVAKASGPSPLAKQTVSSLQDTDVGLTIEFSDGTKAYVMNKAWPQGQVIGYYFDVTTPGTTTMPTNMKNELRRALKDLTNGVNISFKEVTSPGIHTVYVRTFATDLIIEGESAPSTAPGAASVGYLSGLTYNGQLLGQKNTAYFSNSRANGYETYLHEFSHILGFAHEHSRLDRNVHVVSSAPFISGNYWNTTFDKSSIMMYGGIKSVVEQDNPVWQWIGVLPLQSGIDQLARTRVYGAKTVVNNMFYVKSAKNNKYVCRGSNYSIVVAVTPNAECEWDVPTGLLSLGATGQYSGIVLDYNFGSTLRSPTGTYGSRSYLKYENGAFRAYSSGAGVRYNQKWIPFPNMSGGVSLWNGTECLKMNTDGNSLTVATVTEQTLRQKADSPNHTTTDMQWLFEPRWSLTAAY